MMKLSMEGVPLTEMNSCTSGSVCYVSLRSLITGSVTDSSVNILYVHRNIVIHN